MNISLDLPKGRWRDLSAEELDEIQYLVKDSSKTAPDAE
jgi:23S rRNA pseudouridine2604 synthase